MVWIEPGAQGMTGKDKPSPFPLMPTKDTLYEHKREWRRQREERDSEREGGGGRGE